MPQTGTSTYSARIFSTLEITSTIHARLYTSVSVVLVYIATGVVGDEGHDDDLKDMRRGQVPVSQTSPATHGTFQAIRSKVLPQWDCFHSGIVCREARTHLQIYNVCRYLILTVNIDYIIASSARIFHNLFNQTPLCRRLG